MPLISKLHVVITADGVQRTFESEGDGWVVVAAFRSWLTSPDCQLPMAERADEVDIDDESMLPVKFQPALYCEHANESPRGGVCKCPKDCACRERMCAIKATKEPTAKSRHDLSAQLMHEAFFVGSEKYDLVRIMSCRSVRNSSFTAKDVKGALLQLVLDKKIGARTVGDKQEWWRLPPSGSALKSSSPVA